MAESDANGGNFDFVVMAIFFVLGDIVEGAPTSGGDNDDLRKFFVSGTKDRRRSDLYIHSSNA